MSRVSSIFLLIILTAGTGLSQDLGSSNKLFGGKGTDKKSNTKKAGTSKKAPSAVKKSSPSRSSRSAASSPKKTSKAAHSDKDQARTATKPKAEQPRASAPAAENRKPTAGKLTAEKIAQLSDAASTALEKGDLSAAEAKYREILRSEADDVKAKLALSGILAMPVPVADLAGRYEEAMTLAKSVSAKDANNAEAFERLGVAREALGFIDSETENAYRTAIRLSPERAVSYAYLARLLRRKGNSSAAAEMDVAAATRAHSAADLAAIAEVLQSEQRFGAAERIVKIGLQEDPKNALLLRRLGRSQLAGGEVDEAVKSLKDSLAADPANFEAYSTLASAYLRGGDLPNAENTLLRSSRFAHEHERPVLARQLEQLGDAYLSAGKNVESQRAYKLSLTYQPERESVIAKVGRSASR